MSSSCWFLCVGGRGVELCRLGRSVGAAGTVEKKAPHLLLQLDNAHARVPHPLAQAPQQPLARHQGGRLCLPHVPGAVRAVAPQRRQLCYI